MLEKKLDKIDSDINETLRLNVRANVSNDLDEVLLETSGPSFNPDADPRRVMTIEQFGNYILENQNTSYDDIVKKYSKEDGNLYFYDVRSSRGLNNQSRLSAKEAEIAIIKNNDLELSLEHKIDPVEMEKYFVAKDLRKFNGMEEARKTKFDDPKYTEPGGEDYKELVFKLKGDGSYPIEKQIQNSTSSGTEPLKDFKMKSSFPYRSPRVHFGTKNEFAHVRFKTRNLNGQKILTVEEMQSDIVQDMKKNFGERVTDFPFKNNWYELVTKRLIRYAADNDFDAVAITKANTIMNRYKQDAMAIDNLNIKVIKHPRGSTFLDPKDGTTSLYPADAKEPNLYRFVVNYREGDKVQRSLVLNTDEVLESLDGYKVSDEIKNQVNDVIAHKGKFNDDQLIIDAPITKMIVGSGKGKVQLYNQVIPSFMKKYGKKWNAKVYDDNIETAKNFGQVPSPKGMPVTIIQLTDEMKQSVQQDGQALFNIFGIGSGAAIGSNAILDSNRNNTISNITEN